MAKPVSPPEVSPKPKGTLTRDPEVAAMVQTSKLLGALDEPARTRVLRWLVSKYESPISLTLHQADANERKECHEQTN